MYAMIDAPMCQPCPHFPVRPDLTAIQISPAQVVQVLMDLYTELGDNIALQYGGSEAHRKNLGSSGPGKQASYHRFLAQLY